MAFSKYDKSMRVLTFIKIIQLIIKIIQLIAFGEEV